MSLNASYGNGKYIRSEVCYRQWEMTFLENYKGSSTLSCSFMHFGPQTAKVALEFLLTLRFSDDFQDLVANIFRRKHDIDNQGMALETTKGSLCSAKIPCISSANTST